MIFSEQRFSPLFLKTILAFLVLSCCYNGLGFFVSEILACQSVFMLTHRHFYRVGHCSCIWDWARGMCLPGKLWDSTGPHKTHIFNPFLALLSDKFGTKSLKFPLIMWMHEHWISESSIHLRHTSFPVWSTGPSFNLWCIHICTNY